jgi:hypothetical protein
METGPKSRVTENYLERVSQLRHVERPEQIDSNEPARRFNLEAQRRPGAEPVIARAESLGRLMERHSASIGQSTIRVDTTPPLASLQTTAGSDTITASHRPEPSLSWVDL